MVIENNSVRYFADLKERANKPEPKQPKKLLSKGATNYKTAKNNLPTYILYLSPHKDNSKGINICPMASRGCLQACLFTAGRGIFNNVQTARRNKTEFYLSDRDGFCRKLLTELQAINRKGIKTAIRLNGTSDLDFIGIMKNRTGFDILTLKNLIFYDYTKIVGKVEKYLGTNYRLTFSRSEENESQAIALLQKGVSVSVVFDHRKPLPKMWQGFKVIDGDLRDDLMINRKGVVLGLRAKGKAKKDVTGFVVR